MYTLREPYRLPLLPFVVGRSRTGDFKYDCDHDNPICLKHSCIHRQNIAPMELAQLGNKSQKISCSFQLLSLLSVNCENNKSNSLQVYDIRFLEVSDFFLFSLTILCYKFHISSLWVLMYMVTHNCGYLKFGNTFKFL